MYAESYRTTVNVGAEEQRYRRRGINLKHVRAKKETDFGSARGAVALDIRAFRVFEAKGTTLSPTPSNWTQVLRIFGGYVGIHRYRERARLPARTIARSRLFRSALHVPARPDSSSYLSLSINAIPPASARRSAAPRLSSPPVLLGLVTTTRARRIIRHIAGNSSRAASHGDATTTTRGASMESPVSTHGRLADRVAGWLFVNTR